MSCFSLSSGKSSRALFQVDGENNSFRPGYILANFYRTCPEVQPWLYGYDAIQEVEKAVTQNPKLFARQAQFRQSGCSIL